MAAPGALGPLMWLRLPPVPSCPPAADADVEDKSVI
jgi:hypothetical protein